MSFRRAFTAASCTHAVRTWAPWAGVATGMSAMLIASSHCGSSADPVPLGMLYTGALICGIVHFLQAASPFFATVCTERYVSSRVLSTYRTLYEDPLAQEDPDSGGMDLEFEGGPDAAPSTAPPAGAKRARAEPRARPARASGIGAVLAFMAALCALVAWVLLAAALADTRTEGCSYSAMSMPLGFGVSFAVLRTAASIAGV